MCFFSLGGSRLCASGGFNFAIKAMIWQNLTITGSYPLKAVIGGDRGARAVILFGS